MGMSTAFDPANYPETEPADLVIGDRATWKRKDLGLEYPPATFELKYSARLEGESTEIEITATESGNEYIVEVSSVTTGGWTAGRYQWQAYITRSADSERITIDSGSFEVLENRDLSTVDSRSHNRKVLEAIRAVIEDRASKDQESYSIDGRSLSRTPISDLITLENRYAWRVKGEEDAERLANGIGTGNHMQVRI